MMKSHHSKRRILDYYGLQDQKKLEQVPQAEVPVATILFDESHGQLLRSPVRPDVEEVEQKGQLNQILDELKSQKNKAKEEDSTHLAEPGYLTKDILDVGKYKILVLGAPTFAFSSEEIDAIVGFVTDDGGSLLVASNYESLRQQQQNAQDSINSLLKAFGIKFKQLLSYPPDEITDFSPHYLSSEVNRCFFAEPTYLEVLKDLPERLLYPPYVVGRLPRTQEPCLVAVEVGYGRVVAISDFIIFDEEYLKYGNNKQLVRNILRWLAVQNPIDCFDAQIDAEVAYGNTATFSIAFSNPHGNRLEYINCLLESDTGVEILESQEKTIRSIPPYRETRLQWTVKPTGIGTQKLKLTIDSLKERKLQPLYFDSVAQFQCVPNVEIDLVILNQHEKIPELLETGKAVEVKAVFRQKTSAEAIPLKLSLDASSPQLAVETIEQSDMNYRWRLTAQQAGEGTIALVVGETGQRVSRLIQVRPSIHNRIAEIEKTIVAPLRDEIRRQIVNLQCGLEAEEIQQIPFRLYTPEEQVQLLYSGETAEELLEALRVARMETYENLPLVRRLLLQIAPTFSPTYGCCIPYDPELAAHLAKKHRAYEENLAQNFLMLEGYDQIWLEQNIAALILHEQYGHGFFFTQTTLGKQLAILARHGMTRNADPKKMRSPYPRKLYEEYRKALRALWDRSVIVNEGFATWLELAILPLLSGGVGQATYRRKDFLFNRDNSLSILSRDSEYLKQFPALCDSRYQEGCELFQRIQRDFTLTSGIQRVVQAMIEATDVDAGIVEHENQVQFALHSTELLRSILEDSEEDARADERLRKIYICATQTL